MFAFALDPYKSGQHSSKKGDTEIDEDRFGNLAYRYIDHRPDQTKPARDDGDKDPGVEREKKDLKDRVEGNQTRTVLGVPVGKVIPDDDHGNTAGEADKDEADHIFMLS